MGRHSSNLAKLSKSPENVKRNFANIAFSLSEKLDSQRYGTGSFADSENIVENFAPRVYIGLEFFDRQCRNRLVDGAESEAKPGPAPAQARHPAQMDATEEK